jgi:signal transduction histidine kinase
MLHGSNHNPAGRHYTKWALYLILILIPCACFAATGDGVTKPVELQAANFHRDLAGDVRYFEDQKKSMTPAAALKLDRLQDFRPIPTKLVDFGFTRSTFWLRVPVHNATDKPGTWILAVDVPNIERLLVYQTRELAGREVALNRLMHVNETSTFHDRQAAYRNLAVNVKLAAGERSEILLAYSSKQATQLPLSIESPDYFNARIRKEDVHNWSLFALLVGMTLVSTIYLTALGFTTALFYGAYILVSGLYLMHTDGYTFQYLWPASPWWNSVAVAPIGMIMVANGSLFARSFIEAPRFHPRLNQLLLASVTIALFLLAGSFVGLQYDIYKTATILFVVCVAVLYLASGLFAVARGHAGAVFFVCGAIAIISSIVFGAIGYLNPGNFNQDIAGHFGRYALLVEGTAFSLAILLNILSIRRQRDVALRREIEATQAKLAVSEELVAAEKNYSRAVALAETRRARLASTAHDIQQPLSSLRMAVADLSANDEVAARNVQMSFEYLDDLVQSNLDETMPARLDRDGHAQALDNPAEEFPISVVLANVEAMFRDEAKSKGIKFRHVPSTARIRAEPIVLMRVVSNLVSNALKFTGSGKVLFGCRRRAGSICIEVLDTGAGMTQEQIDRLVQPYERGSSQPGTGLGLALVRELSHNAGWRFTLSSEAGRGSRAIVCIPHTG